MNPNIAIAILLTTFVLLIMIKCPITFSMIISTAFTIDVYKRQVNMYITTQETVFIGGEVKISYGFIVFSCG